jgi:hypothetical protein
MSAAANVGQRASWHLKEWVGFGRALRGKAMDLTQIIGFVAGFGTTFAALPDLIAMLKRRSSVGMNPRMAAITGSFQILCG